MPSCAARSPTFPECARIAAHLHPVHQLVLWLQRVLGLRISEAFGLLVDDVIDLGDSGLLLVRAQGGHAFTVRDENGQVATVTHKETTKTQASARALVVASIMMDPLRVAIDAFHTDPETADADDTARLVPGIRIEDESGQLGFREAFETAAAAEGLGSSDLGFRVSPHLLRKSVATDLAWQPGRSAHVEATLGAAGWTVDPDSGDDPLCGTGRVASELQVAPTTAKRWMREGTLMCVIVQDGGG